MANIVKSLLSLSTALLLVITLSSHQNQEQKKGWIKLFDGKSLDGWKASENPESFKVEDGAIVVFGNRAHLFYMGSVRDHAFKNFEYKAKVMTKPGANSGMYIHTEFQEEGWPSKGYEIQVNNSHTDWRRTGSVYALQDVKEAPAKDDKWFTQHIIVQGNKITVKVDGKTINEYTVPAEGGKLSTGTFALQAHDPKSKVYYKDIMVKVLPD
ncbi:MAG TPA: DUF1080 domain-containing protein [Chryseosolibacter sp.]|nr:DUF1080 domain-containing protein [Chryseosolibacter sp.]